MRRRGWGGRRRGAGAPAGNLNALKHGRSSEQLKQLFLASARAPVRRLLRLIDAARHLSMAGLVGKRRSSRRRRTGCDSQAGHQQGEEQE